MLFVDFKSIAEATKAQIKINKFTNKPAYNFPPSGENILTNKWVAKEWIYIYICIYI